MEHVADHGGWSGKRGVRGVDGDTRLGHVLR
jgi:hypothetical protein